MVAQTRHGGGNASGKKRLAFHEKLSGKAVTTDALLKKLNTLHQQLAALEQEHVDVNSLSTVRTELIHTSLLLHKDRGVKAYTACCLADILRLYAPEAPYTQHELRDIFQFFFRQLSAGFKGQDEPYYTEYFHLIESLSTVKSVVLVCDLPSADELLTEIFRDLFTIAKRDFTRKVELYMADILVALIDECNSLPSDVLEGIMAQFIDKNARNDQPGYRLAVQVCNGATDKLQRHVCQYFGDLLTSDSAEDGEEADQESIRTSHDLIKRLFRSCAGVLHSVIPILESELRSDGLDSRLLATQTLGEMYADKGGMDLVKKYPTTWTCWINRKSDIAVAVRLKCVESTPGLITNLPECRETLAELLNAKIYDPDEKIRAAACKVYSHLDYESALHHVSEEQLRSVVGRGLDKKHLVRAQALNSIGKLYSLAYPEIENNDPAAIHQFAWIPDEILQMTLANSEIRSLVEQVLAEYIIPLPSLNTSSATKEKEVDEAAWVDRMLIVMRYLSEKSVQLLIGLSGLKSLRPNIYDFFLESCVKNNGGIIDGDEDAVVKRLKIFIQHLSVGFPDPLKASEDFHTFAKLNENRLYKLLKTCMDPLTDLKTLIKSTNEFTKRVEQQSSSILPTMSTFLRRATYWIFNQSAVPTLLQRIRKVNGPRQSEGKPTPNTKSHLAAASAMTILTAVAKQSPALFRPHVAELCKVIASGFEETSGKGTVSVEIALMALANVVRWDTKLAAGLDKHSNERIVKLALGKDWRQAKFAARYLAFAKNSAELCTEVIDSIADSIQDRAKLAVAQIAVLRQLAILCPDAFEHKSDVIMSYLVKKVLMAPSPAGMADEDEEWFEDEDVPDELRSKILALKVIRNRCLAHKSDEQALEIATPVLKVLASLLEFEGSVNGQADEDPKFKSRMRLQAANSLLHLSTSENFANAIAPKFVRLVCVIQDPCFNVRLAFLSKTIHLLQPRKLPARYNVIPFLTVIDPESETKLMAASYIETTKRKLAPALRLENLELLFIRLLHFLAHHPDFSTTHDELMDMASYVQFYLDHIATPENVSLLYHLANKGKTVRDAESHAYSVNFYVMCELAQALIKTRAQAQSWTLPSYPGKVKLPSDILRPLPNAEAINEILKMAYLPAETDRWISEKFRVGGTKEKKERVPAKRKAPNTKSNGHTKRSKKRAGTDVSENESLGGEDSDVDMGEDQPKMRRQRTSDGSEGGTKPRLSRAERLNARTLAKETRETKNKEPSSDMEEDGG